MQVIFVRSVAVVLLGVSLTVQAIAQEPPRKDQSGNGSGVTPPGTALPPGYVIGAEDVLSIVFWRDKEMSAEVVVRPDGKISLPLINDLQASGYTPEQLRTHIEKAAAKYLAEPNAAVVVKAINSRQVYITGNVMKPSAYPLSSEMTVLQLIAVAGGLQEYADGKHIVVMRTEQGRNQHFRFNYKEVIQQKNLQQNVVLKPGDTVVVP